MTENKAIVEIESVLDNFYRNDYKLSSSFNTKYYFNSFKQKELKEVVSYYEPLLEEISSDSEGINLNKIQKKNYINLLENIIDSCKEKLPITKPRKKKIKSHEDLTKKLFYLNNIEDIYSIDPKLIIGSKILITYNDEYKKITVFYSDVGFTIEGSTLLNFTENSFQRRLKGKIDILNFLKLPIKVIIETVKNMPTKSEIPTGRINKLTLLVKVSK